MSGPKSSRDFIYSFGHLMCTEPLAALACARRGGGWVSLKHAQVPALIPGAPSSIPPPQLSPQGPRYKDLPRPLAFRPSSPPQGEHKYSPRSMASAVS